MIKRLITSLIYIFSFVFPFLIYAQNGNGNGNGNTNGNGYGVFMSFAKNGVEHKAGEVVTNVLKVVNNTNKEQNFILEISLPNGWNMIGQRERGFTLAAKDSAFFPIRTYSNSSIKGNISYVVSAILRNEDGYVISNSFWDIFITKTSAWSVSVPTNNIYFYYNEDTTQFKMRLFNEGSSDEAVLLTLKPNRNLKLLIPGYDNILPYTNVFYLPPGKDTTLIYKVHKVKREIAPSHDNYFERNENYESSNNTYNIRVFIQDEVKNKKGSKQWGANIKFLGLKNLFVYSNFSYAILPLTFEMNVYDILGENTFLNLELYGTAYLPRERTLNYHFASNFHTNYFNKVSFLGNYRNISYITKYWFAEIGSVSGAYGLSGGDGITIGGNYKNNKLAFGFSRNPFYNFTKKAKSVSYSLSHSYGKGFISIGNNIAHTIFRQNSVKNTLYRTSLNLYLNKQNRLNFGFGYTRHQNNNSNQMNNIYNGYSYLFGYSFNYRRFAFGANTNFGSSGYIYNSNYLNYNGMIRYGLSSNSNLSFNYNHSESNPQISILGKYTNSFKNRNDLYSLVYSYSNPKYSISINPFYNDLENYTLRTQDKKLGLYITPRIKDKYFKVNISNISGYTKVVGYDIPNFFTSMFRFNIRYKAYNSSIRYNYGPYQSNELYNFVRTKVNVNSLFILNNYNYWFNKKTMQLIINLNYRYENYYKSTRIYTRPEWFYYTNNGWRFSFYSYYSLYNKKGNKTNFYNSSANRYDEITNQEQRYHNLEFGFGIKKDIGIPISYKKFFTIQVVAFKDNNGNRIKDDNEEGISNMIIKINRSDLVSDTIEDITKAFPNVITNNEGKASYKNIPMGTYSILASPLSYNEGWFDVHEIIVPLDKNQIVYIPLNRGVKISGGIIFEKDKISRLDDRFNLANIKITAIDSLNNQYSSLTDREGNFVLFVPKGKYILTLNEAALGSNFEYLQNNIPLELTNNIENYFVNFYVVEKSEEMNIKKFNKAGNLKDTKTTSTDAFRPESGSALSDKKENQDTLKTNKKEGDLDTKTKSSKEEKQRETTKPQKSKGIPEIIDITNTEQLSEKEIKEINAIVDKQKKVNTKIEKQYSGDFVDSSMFDPFAKTSKNDKTSSMLNVDNKRHRNTIIKPVNNPQAFKNQYGIQIRSSKYPLSDKLFTDTLKIKFNRNQKVNEFEKNNEYKYTVGRFKDINQAQKANDSLKKLYPNIGSFVINYNDINEIGTMGEIVEIDENGNKLIYRIQISSSRSNVEADYFARKFNITDRVYLFKMDGVNKYSIGNFNSYQEAKEFNKEFQRKYKINDSFITPYYNGKRITFKILEGLIKD